MWKQILALWREVGAAGLNGRGISANVLVTLYWNVVQVVLAIITGLATSVAVIMGTTSLACHPLLPARHLRNCSGWQEVEDSMPD